MTIAVVTIPGNFFSAAEYLNENKLGEYLIQFQHIGNYTQAVLVLPADLATKLKIEKVI